MITMPNVRGDVAVVVPTKPDGTYYRFEMIHHGDARRSYADTITGLVAALIDGYADIDFADTTAADHARLVHAGAIQVALQAAHNAAADLAGLDDDTVATLTRPRNTPVIVDSWDQPVGLVVLTSDYLEADRPDGNLIWLDPTTETGLIESLAQAGVITVAEHTPQPNP